MSARGTWEVKVEKRQRQQDALPVVQVQDRKADLGEFRVIWDTRIYDNEEGLHAACTAARRHRKETYT